jgi:hypothetical protein
VLVGPVTLAAEGGVNPGHAVANRNNGVRDGQRGVLVGMDADLGGGVEDVAVDADPVADVVHGEPTAWVGDVDAVCAVGLHERGLSSQLLGRSHVGEHQEALDVHADLAGGGNVLGGDVGLGAI